ncbi:MAG: DNRLRE domain-containing protein [Planctomycetaceae bacterium]|nr:DNRLRE domain-containing protein [Planctomycetaceae bacterium]
MHGRRIVFVFVTVLMVSAMAHASIITTDVADNLSGTQSMKQDWFVGGLSVWGGGSNTQNVYGCALRFDLSGLDPTKEVTSATLVLQASGNPQAITVWQFTTDPTSTYKFWSASKTTAASFSVTTPGSYTIDLTSLVQGWLSGTTANYGLFFTGPRYSGANTSFEATNYTQNSQGPHLSVSQLVADVPEPATMSLLVLGGVAVLVRRKRRA